MVSKSLSHYKIPEELGRYELVMDMQTADLPIGDTETRAK